MNKNEKKETKTDEAEIELVDIEDLRTAFGGEGVHNPEDKQSPYAHTRMCSGWNQDN